MKRKLIPLAAAFVIAVGYIACCAAVDKELIPPRTSVNGIDISGMKVQEAVSLLESDVGSHRSETVISVRFEEKEYPVDVGSAIEWECQSAIEEIQKPVQGAFLTRGYYYIKSVLAGNVREALPVLKNEEAIEEAIDASGLIDAGTTKQTAYKIEKDSLVFTIGTAGEEADIDELKKELETAVQEGNDTVIECPVRDGKVEDLDLDAVYQEVYKQPENATLDPENNYQIKEAVKGIRFDVDKAREMLDSAEEGSTVTVELITEEPEVTTADLKEHLFSDKLASYTTEVRGTENRKDNIRLATEKCNGAILLSGDTFSYNDMVGEQTAETGYKLANATLDGQVIQAYGGGICQVSSTIFAAALYANLNIKERWEHEFVSSYIAAGMDAAVAWDMLDLKIGNNKDYPVQFEIVYEDDILTVNIWGTKTDDSIIEVDTMTIDDSGGRLCVQTNRRVYNGDRSQVFVEQIASSTYIN